MCPRTAINSSFSALLLLGYALLANGCSGPLFKPAICNSIACKQDAQYGWISSDGLAVTEEGKAQQRLDLQRSYSDASNKKEMINCIQRHLAESQYSSAGEANYNHCQSEKEQWLKACLASRGNNGYDAIASRDCETERRDIEAEIDQNDPRSRRRIEEQNRQPLVVEEAFASFNAGRPLAGLPNLSKPVYLANKSLICSSPGALANSQVATTIAIGVCIFSPSRIRVQIIQPRTQEKYIEQYVGHYIQILWKSPKISDATPYLAWVRMGNLAN